MRATIVVLALLILAGLAGAQAVVMFQKKIELTRAVETHLEDVGDSPVAVLKKDIVDHAARIGVQLVPDNIRLTSEDTQDRTYPQRLLEGRVAQFTNKRVSIAVRYSTSILGILVHQEVQAQKIKTIQVQSVAPHASIAPMLDVGD